MNVLFVGIPVVAVTVGIIVSVGMGSVRNYTAYKTGSVLSSFRDVLPTLTMTPTPSPTVTPTLTVTPTPRSTATPTITPIPTVSQPQFSPQQIDEWFKRYSSQNNISEALLRKIAVCESGYNQFSKSKYYAGMFQYSESTWRSTRMAMGENPDPSLRMHAEEAIKTTAWKIAHQGTGAWPNCGK